MKQYKQPLFAKDGLGRLGTAEEIANVEGLPVDAGAKVIAMSREQKGFNVHVVEDDYSLPPSAYDIVEDYVVSEPVKVETKAGK